MTAAEIRELKLKAREIRRRTVEAIGNLGIGHIGGCLSIVEALVILYHRFMNVDPRDPRRKDRDLLVLSKGHAGPALYSILADRGFFPSDWLKTLNRGGSRLPSHCDMHLTPGIDMTTGSLGQGLSAAVGMALANRLDGIGSAVYVILGDGECNEGQVWEAAMAASQYRLDRIVAFVDYNKMELDGYMHEVMDTRKLIELAEKDPAIVVVEADLMRANGTGAFKARFPERAFNLGCAEANMVGVAAGLSARGKIPFASSFACFAARRAYDQFFISANYARLNVKLVGTDPGILAAYNGGTHMPFEDVGLIRLIPECVVVDPADGASLGALLPQLAYHQGSTYLRLNRKESPPVYAGGEKLALGRGFVLRDGRDVTLIACGAVLVPQALQAAEALGREGVSAAVIDMHTIKPIDEELVLEYARKTGRIVTCENHQVGGGLGSAVAEVLAERRPTPMRRVGVRDRFGQVGPVEYLLEAYGLDAATIACRARELLER